MLGDAAHYFVVRVSCNEGAVPLEVWRTNLSQGIVFRGVLVVVGVVCGRLCDVSNCGN